MNKLFAYLVGAAYGAGFMYFWDPTDGKRRRAMLRDQVDAFRNDADDVIHAGFRDLQNRARGMAMETTNRFRSGQTDDWVLAERVRSRLGILTTHTRGIDVRTQDGVVTLEGDALQDETDRIVAGLRKVRGVQNVENRLRVHQEAGDIPTLQGGMDDWRRVMSSGQWRPSTRLMAGIGALYLLLRGRGGGLFGPFYTMGGWALGLRTIMNRPFSDMIRSGQNRNLINVNKSIRIDVPVDEVYDIWSDFPSFPHFMEHVKEVREMGNGRSHWVVDGPAGKKVEFDAILTQDIPNEMIAWETTEDSPVKHVGQVRFRPAMNGGTQVNVHMGYNPPAGVLGAAVATFFGSDPKSQMDDDLMRLKQLLETGSTRKGQTEAGEQYNRIR